MIRDPFLRQIARAKELNLYSSLNASETELTQCLSSAMNKMMESVIASRLLPLLAQFHLLGVLYPSPLENRSTHQ